MSRVRFTSTSCLQSSSGSGEIVSFAGETGEVKEVPDDVAVLLIEHGVAEKVTAEPVKKPAAPPQAHRANKRRA